VPAKQQPALVTQLPTPGAVRLACTPETHYATGTCDVCEAWEQGVALFAGGERMARQRYVSLHEPKP